MANKIIIVESPAKAKTIKEILKGEYDVLSSKGHVRDLPEKEFGVNIEKDFEPTFKIIYGKEKIVQELKKKAKNKQVLLGSDMDREGEAIAWHLADILGVANEKNRIIFNEITPQAIKNAVKEPRNIDMNKVHAQLARRILDRIVGYKISPLLWKMLKTSSSAGRVQSAALKIVCEREIQRHKFQPKKFWKVQGYIGSLKFYLTHIDGKKIDMQQIDEKLAKEIEKNVKVLKVIQIKTRKIQKKAPSPFITSTLQQEAANKLGFSVKKTMQIAQQLYEGIDTPKGHRAFITYMRTDSTRVSEIAKQKAIEFITDKFGKNYLGKKVRTEKAKQNVQDAHEAIRPVNIDLTPDQVEGDLGKDQYRLYKLIWERFMASQMADAIYEETTIQFQSDRYTFESKIERRIFDGFEIILKKDKEQEITIPSGEIRISKWQIEEDETKPPARYTEASMVRALEIRGIGRPSTYATIISTLLERKYVIKSSNQLIPTVMGFVVNHYLEKKFPEIVDLQFTAKMEEALDKIEQGQKDYKELLRDFYNDFSKYLDEAQQKWLSIDMNTNLECDCKSRYKLKVGRYGLYLLCENCSKTTSLALETPAVFYENTMYFTHQEKESIETVCPVCGGKLEQMSGRYGNYIKCQNCGKTYTGFARGKCPKCSAVVEKKISKNKRIFFKCTSDNCDFISWLEPSNETCPECSQRLYYKKYRSKEVLYCQNCKKTFQLKTKK
ncbi:type I DNA topoisomerase [Pseudothermotoga sp.]|uniref:type I DNA topoisomerase n=1 Tax=Pseudothermotoga sp. TaxID=2033661 RepID=UPI00258E17A3|nr:type I DNA topoisomerase [Pseudothermotoga sp.]MDK2885226.1 topoisomerase [Pseudothermotoga sp.]